jgi:hypothetical protein
MERGAIYTYPPFSGPAHDEHQTTSSQMRMYIEFQTLARRTQYLQGRSAHGKVISGYLNTSEVLIRI